MLELLKGVKRLFASASQTTESAALPTREDTASVQRPAIYHVHLEGPGQGAHCGASVYRDGVMIGVKACAGTFSDAAWQARRLVRELRTRATEYSSSTSLDPKPAEWVPGVGWLKGEAALQERERMRKRARSEAEAQRRSRRLKRETMFLENELPVRILRHDNGAECAIFSTDGRRVLTRNYRISRVWDSETGRPLTPEIGHMPRTHSASFSPDGAAVVTAGDDKAARIWSSQTGEQIAPTLAHRHAVYNADFSPDGARVVTAAGDGIVRVWDARTGEELVSIDDHSGPPVFCAYSSDSTRVVTASLIGASTWDAGTGERMTPPVAGSLSNVPNAAHLLDGDRILIIGRSAAQVWSSQHGRALTPPMTHKGRITSAVLNRDGTRLATTGSDRTARIWDTRTGGLCLDPLAHSFGTAQVNYEGVLSPAFSADSRHLLTVSDYVAYVWDAETGKLKLWLPHEHLVSSARFDVRDTRVVTAARDGRVRIWAIDLSGRASNQRPIERHWAVAGVHAEPHPYVSTPPPAFFAPRSR